MSSVNDNHWLKSKACKVVSIDMSPLLTPNDKQMKLTNLWVVKAWLPKHRSFTTKEQELHRTCCKAEEKLRQLRKKLRWLTGTFMSTVMPIC